MADILEREREAPAHGAILIADGACNAVRWRAGERLNHLFEARCRDIEAGGGGDTPALDVGGATTGFLALNERADRFAEALRGAGVRAGDRVGLILDRSAEAYAALIGVLKAGAAFVPLDAKFPPDRIGFIAEDAGIERFVVADQWAGLVAACGREAITLGRLAEAAERVSLAAAPAPAPDLAADTLCYIIYTSGSTGRPKGVAVNHSSICNFVRVAAQSYGYQPGDRVYQGITLAFDFSVEELWVPLIAGATLVPSPAESHLVGAELARFLKAHRITAMCVVPTLLATMEDDLPDLRLLLVSGEACPQDLVQRWHRAGRRMLNAYGPTEATVTATWTELAPGKAVTIGVPLATYTIAILEAGADRLAAPGATGEIAIAGVGLAVGYLNRENLTQQAFVPDFLHLANNPSRRLYRTGDLGRINEAGEIVYLGRIDQQVKLRGYRIELAEIENVLLEVEGVAQAVVTVQEVQPGLEDLVAYYTCFKDRAPPAREDLLAQLKGRLPGYMVPAYLEELDVIPLLASHKADRKALPRPSGPRVVFREGDFVAPRDDLETVIAACLTQTLGIEQVSVNDHFFDDLGAHSLLMAQFLNALNVRLPEADAAIADVYLEPTVGELAQALRRREGERGREAAATTAAPVEPATVASDFQHALCGAMQAAFYVGRLAVYGGLMVAGYLWVVAAEGAGELVGRALLAVCGLLAFSLAAPVVAKWLVIGRFEAGRVPLWSLAYYRFWVVRQMMALNPILLFRGSALFNAYLRLLGATVGHGAVVLCRGLPVAADLIRIGDGAVLRRDAYIAGYKAERGWLVTGPVTVGVRALVGDGAVLDIDTEVGADGQLGHASALHPGERVPAGKRYHGNPARETGTDFVRLERRATSRFRRGLHSAVLLAGLVGSATFAVLVATAVVSALFGIGRATGAGLIGGALAYSLAVFLLLRGLAFAVHIALPRCLRAGLREGEVYPLYGVRHLLAQALSRLSVSMPFQTLLGDSSYAVDYFGWLGFKQPDMRQTGSNFGCATSYDSPADVTVGAGTMISDGLRMANMEVGPGTFRLMPVRIGKASFVGNVVVYPAAGRTGDNCLLATKVAVPVDGPVREGVGLLGSPAFEIPRQVASRQRFDPVPATEEGRARLRAKNRFNLRTMAFFLLMQWLLLFALAFAGMTGAALYPALGWPAVALTVLALPVLVLAHAIVSERAGGAGIRITPRAATIHEPYYWWIERHWKFSETVLKSAFAGTPFRPMVLRLVGLEVGRKVFDDGVTIPEKPLVAIGDHATLNAEVALQGHSLEDGLYKADRIRIGAGATVAPCAFVHYGARLGEGSVLEADSFMMKGAASAAGSRWRGNPARPVRC